MQSNKRNGLKPSIIKHMALLMGICYLINPLLQQINTVLHTIVHELTPPASILGHNSPHGKFEVHQSPDHYAPNFEHDHKIVDLVNTFFEASNEDDNPSEPNFIDVKWDKHITSTRFKLVYHQDTLEKNCFWSSASHLIKGHSKKLEEPPQNFLS